MQDAVEHEAKAHVSCADDDVDYRRDRSKGGSRSHLERARARLDVVAMLLERRRFASYLSSGSIIAVNLYSDASPVTGAELQASLEYAIKPRIAPSARSGFGVPPPLDSLFPDLFTWRPDSLYPWQFSCLSSRRCIDITAGSN